MGCKPVKKAVKKVWKFAKPYMIRVGVAAIDELDDHAYDILTGEMKLKIAGRKVKEAVVAEGKEIRTSMAEALVQNLVALKRMGEEELVREMAELPDSEDDDLPEIDDAI